ncbi:MAG: hydrolase [Firmicutes bacterium]|jgi:nicotinamidase-related amidase|nr:hydrolase [Bacillota bacterium]
MERIRITRDNCFLVGIDYQERLVPAMSGKEGLLDASARLIRGFEILGLPVLMTQQYPKGLGQTIPAIKEAGEADYIDKVTFSAWKTDEFVQKVESLGRKAAVVVGIETHVCEQQTVLDMIDAGYTVYVAADCVASRKESDRDIAIRCMEAAGAVITTYEAILFELLVTAKAPEFKAISNLVK